MRGALVFLPVLIAVCLLPFADAWFALTKEGYRVKGNLTNEGHLLVIDNIKLEGVLLLGQNNSESGELDGINQKCDALKEGALRYNNTHVEGCKQNRWRPLAFCDYECRPRDDVRLNIITVYPYLFDTVDRYPAVLSSIPPAATESPPVFTARVCLVLP